jgi:beta-alanine--pyruvate transaminase
MQCERNEAAFAVHGLDLLTPGLHDPVVGLPLRRLAPIWEQAAHVLRDAPHVVDVRNIGLLAAIDLAPRDGAPGARGAECAKWCFDDDVLIRSSGDTLVLSPPLIISENQIEMVFATIRRALDTID